MEKRSSFQLSREGQVCDDKECVDVQHMLAPPGKKYVGIIGCGASGLILMKELLQKGHKVACFEVLPRLGGVYAKSYDNTMLTTSSCLTAFSDHSDGKEGCPKFWTDEEYLNYLETFAEKHDILKYVQFKTRVESVQKCNQTGRWVVTVKGNRWSPTHRTYGEVEAEKEDEPVRAYSFDCIAVATGTNQWPSLPRFEGQEKFKGTIVHSDEYKHAEDYAGKRVLVVGAGESGSDICNEISKHADKVAIAVRGKHGHLIPRIQKDGRVTDLNTNRCRYSNPYILGDWIGFTTQACKKFLATMAPETDETKVLKKIGEFNMMQKTSAFSKFGCKNAGFVEAVVLRGAELHRDGFCLNEKGAVFQDGSVFECDEIVACTGYKNVFPFFDNSHPELGDIGKNPRLLYKQVFPPAYGWEVAFFGFARPAFGSIPPTVEMQARYYSMVLNHELCLPDEEKMECIADSDRENWESRFGYDAKRVKGLVDFQLYTDDMAKLIGCMPDLWSLFWNKPNVWLKIMFGPFTMHQYRLQGPYSDCKRAEEVYKRQLYGDFLESAITATFLCTSKVLSVMGFKQFTPNNF